jgi:uncharacterized membrane protein
MNWAQIIIGSLLILGVIEFVMFAWCEGDRDEWLELNAFYLVTIAFLAMIVGGLYLVLTGMGIK